MPPAPSARCASAVCPWKRCGSERSGGRKKRISNYELLNLVQNVSNPLQSDIFPGCRAHFHRLFHNCVEKLWGWQFDKVVNCLRFD